jgi:hypothetical protein
MPCSFTITTRADIAASGTGFIFGAVGFRDFAGSVVAARRVSLAAASMLPSR